MDGADGHEGEGEQAEPEDQSLNVPVLASEPRSGRYNCDEQSDLEEHAGICGWEQNVHGLRLTR